jgi:hypothetical protein
MSFISRCIALALLSFVTATATAGEPDASAPRIAAVMEFELIDDMRDYERPEVKDAQNRNS